MVFILNILSKQGGCINYLSKYSTCTPGKCTTNTGKDLCRTCSSLLTQRFSCNSTRMPSKLQSKAVLVTIPGPRIKHPAYIRNILLRKLKINDELEQNVYQHNRNKQCNTCNLYEHTTSIILVTLELYKGMHLYTQPRSEIQSNLGQ
jgi:hypothetical protein